jgi:transposase InsO family protein
MREADGTDSDRIDLLPLLQTGPMAENAARRTAIDDGSDHDDGPAAITITTRPDLQSSMADHEESPIGRPLRRETIGGYGNGETMITVGGDSDVGLRRRAPVNRGTMDNDIDDARTRRADDRHPADVSGSIQGDEEQEEEIWRSMLDEDQDAPVGEGEGQIIPPAPANEGPSAGPDGAQLDAGANEAVTGNRAERDQPSQLTQMLSTDTSKIKDQVITEVATLMAELQKEQARQFKEEMEQQKRDRAREKNESARQMAEVQQLLRELQEKSTRNDSTIMAAQGPQTAAVLSVPAPVMPPHHPTHINTQAREDALASSLSQLASVLQSQHTKPRGDNKTTISRVKNTSNVRVNLMEWQMQLEAANVPREDWVKRVLQEMDKDGNLYTWTEQYRCQDPGRSEEPQYIHNWSWDKFQHKLQYHSVGLWQVVNKGELFEKFLAVKCGSAGTEADIQKFTADFIRLYQECLSNQMQAYFTDAMVAQKFYSGLPDHVRIFMNRGKSPGDAQQLRASLDAVIIEVNNVLRDAECRQNMLDRANQPKPRLVGGAAVGGATTKDKAGKTRIGNQGDYIAFFRTTSEAPDVARAFDALVKNQGAKLAFKIGIQRNPGTRYIIVTHPTYQYLVGLPELPQVTALNLKWAGQQKKPMVIDQNQTPTAAASTPAPAAATSAAAAQPIPQVQTQQQLEAEIARLKEENNALNANISTLSSSSAASTIAPGDSASQIHATRAQLAPPIIPRVSRSAQAIAPGIYVQSDIAPASTHHHLPPQGGMVARMNLSHVAILYPARNTSVQPVMPFLLTRPRPEVEDFSMIEEEAQEPGDNIGALINADPDPSYGSQDPAERYLRSLGITLWSDMEELTSSASVVLDGGHICDDSYIRHMTTIMCGPDKATIRPLSTTTSTPALIALMMINSVLSTASSASFVEKSESYWQARVRRRCARARDTASKMQDDGHKVHMMDTGHSYILVRASDSSPIFPIWHESRIHEIRDHFDTLEMGPEFVKNEAHNYERRMKQLRLRLQLRLRQFQLRRSTQYALRWRASIEKSAKHRTSWHRLARGIRTQARQLVAIGIRLQTTCPRDTVTISSVDTITPIARRYLDPDKHLTTPDTLLVIALGLGLLVDTPAWMRAAIYIAMLSMVFMLSSYAAAQWKCAMIAVRHRHGRHIMSHARAIGLATVVLLPSAYASNDDLGACPQSSPWTTSTTAMLTVMIAIFGLGCGWMLGGKFSCRTSLQRSNSAHIIANPVYLEGPTDPRQRNVPALRACAAINFNGELHGKRLGMLDSGCNSLIMRFDDELRKHITHWDNHDICSGDAANGKFNTNGTALVGMNLEFQDMRGDYQTLHIATRTTLCDQFQWDLFPTRWFQNFGHSVLFDGIQSSSHEPDSGDIQVQLHQLHPNGRQQIGNLKLCHWSGLTFFPFTLVNSAAVYSQAVSIEPDRQSKAMLTTKWHTIFGCAGARRVYSALRRVGIEVFAELHVPCLNCAETKTHMPSRRMYERNNVPIAKVRGDHFAPDDPGLAQAVSQLRQSNDAVEHQEAKWDQHGTDIPEQSQAGVATFHGPAVRRGQFLHCDTISLGQCWKGYREALIITDECTHEIFTYAMKSKSGKSVAEALHQHFLRERATPEGIHYYCHRVELHSDQGSEFINADVHTLCQSVGAIQTYSCPGGLGKWQNGVCERKIKDLGSIMRSIMSISALPPAAAVYAMYQAQDILNDLPTKAHNGLNGCPTSTDGLGLSPRFVAFQADLDVDHWFAFGSYCSVHLDDDHKVPGDNLRSAARCVYLSKAHHEGASGHILWDLKNQRRLTVPRPTRSQWNYFPLRPAGQRHLSSSFTFETPDVEDDADRNAVLRPLPPDLENFHIDSDDASTGPVNLSPHLTRHQIMMHKNIGKTIRKLFFISGIRGDTDYFEGKVISVTANNKYNVVYTDKDSEEMSHKDFLIWSRDVAQQIQAKSLICAGQAMTPPKCNCSNNEVCTHPWGKSYQKETDNGTGKVRTGDKNMPTYTPSNIPPPSDQVDYYAIMAFGDRMTQVDVQTQECRQNTENSIRAHASRRNSNKKSAYPTDPQSITGCQRSENWEKPEQGNSWKESILTEVNNLIKYGVYIVVDASEATNKKIFPSLINFLTKRTKDSTPENEKVDKRKTRICFGGHRCVLGEDYTKVDSYAPVPTWSSIKIQLALTALHGMQLKAFDACAAYLQTPIDKEMYVRPPPGLMSMLGKDTSAIWKLRQVLYGYPRGAFLWYQKLFTYLKSYGFKTLGNSATFLMLDRKDDPECPGVILMNVYSDDGLASTSSEQLWAKFMEDFKKNFDIEEKDPDYFLGAAITQDDSGAIILDPSKYLREVAAKYDMSRAVPTSLPLPAGSKLYMNDSDDDDCTPEEVNLYQQMAGSVMYASLLRPSVMYYASQLGKVMSRPTREHLRKARQVIQYLNSTADEVITFRPEGCDGWSAFDVQLLAFSDSDWACAVDTRRSHGCHVVMLAGAAIAWRSRSHKSVMLSTAGAEYYEASEACREIAFVRSILADYYGMELPPTPLLIDNAAAIAMGQMPQFTEKQKHLPIRICHLKECCTEGMVQLWPVSTVNELADVGTKALSQVPFDRLNSVLMGRQRMSALLATDPNFQGQML